MAGKNPPANYGLPTKVDTDDIRSGSKTHARSWTSVNAKSEAKTNPPDFV